MGNKQSQSVSLESVVANLTALVKAVSPGVPQNGGTAFIISASGRPGSGKSSLLNDLLGFKLFRVSSGLGCSTTQVL
jgi:tRNA U34 5-carboxymethylaminomethyl modifying GTPase MnmE/TrmE